MSSCITHFTNQIVKVEFHICISRKHNTLSWTLKSKNNDIDKDIYKDIDKDTDKDITRCSELEPGRRVAKWRHR